MTVQNIHTNRIPDRQRIQEEILDKLAYFAVFNHPLRAGEIQNLLCHDYDISLINDVLDRLAENNTCKKHDGFYALTSDILQAVTTRKAHEEHAKKYFAKLPAYARIISNFPFVRSVAVSGSLSKGVMHRDGDIDYFIITAHNRLWLARVLLVLFKKIFLFNRRRYFCVNYFVSEQHLQIPDENIFTATEIVSLIPVYGGDDFNRFKKQNSWVSRYYGHFHHPYQVAEVSPRLKWLKHLSELLLNNRLGEWLDVLCMRITIRRWHMKFKNISSAQFDLTMRSTRHVSKHHPRDFQTFVLEKMNTLRPTLQHVPK